MAGSAIAHQQEKQTRQMATESQWSQVLAAISDAVLTEKFDSIAELLQTSFADSNLAEHRLELREMESLCRAAAGLNQRLLATFLPQKGLTITLRMKQGTEQRTIREVTGTSILTENISPLGSGYVIQPQTVTLDDLTLMELQERLGAATTPETSLLRGILAMRDKNFDAAARAFEDVGEPLGPVLTGAVAHHCSRQREKEAWTELSKILARAQIHVKGPLPDGQLAAMLKQRKLSEMEMRLLHQAVAVFQTRYTGTDCARQAEALWKAASPDAANTIKVAIETEADTYDALLANLNNHNPGLQQDEIICWLDWQDRPERLEIISPNLRTLQPLEQLPSLRELICGGQRPGNRSDTIILAPLDDLTPLRYLPIRTLSVAYTRVKNLAPIKDMVSLTRLSLAQTDVADLTQLAALHLTALDLSHTKINDLTPLQNMPLRELNLNHTDISDLAVLRGKHLTDLRAAYTRIRDLTPLSNIPLSTLDIRGVAVSDLSPLAGMPLERLGWPASISAIWGATQHAVKTP